MDLEALHGPFGGTVTRRSDVEVVDHYGRPDRAHRAVRNGAGVIHSAVDVLVVTGSDRHEFLDNAVSNRVPTADGSGCYAVLLEPQGAIEYDLEIYATGERLLVFLPSNRAPALEADWTEKVFIQDVEIDTCTDEYDVFGVHGPRATEKVASVLSGATPPERPYRFDRGQIAGAGVTVIGTDAPTGEEGYQIVTDADRAKPVLEALVHEGPAATPFGYRTWDALTLEAGTPLFPTELEGRLPNDLGLRSAVDYEKGCFVGQEVVSRIENRGQPANRLIGLEFEAGADVPAAGAAVIAGNERIGELTRAAESPHRERPIGLALVEFETGADIVTVRVDGNEQTGTRVALPFVEGSARSGRLPVYPID